MADGILKSDTPYGFNNGSSVGGGTFSSGGSGDGQADQVLQKGDLEAE